MQRVFHPVAVHFKGSGFYNTDYGTRKRAREKDEPRSREQERLEVRQQIGLEERVEVGLSQVRRPKKPTRRPAPSPTSVAESGIKLGPCPSFRPRWSPSGSRSPTRSSTDLNDRLGPHPLGRGRDRRRLVAGDPARVRPGAVRALAHGLRLARDRGAAERDPPVQDRDRRPRHPLPPRPLASARTRCR